MRRSRGTLWQALLWLCLGAARLLSGTDSFFIEAEEFQFYGGWHREGGDTSSGRAHLLMSQTTLERGLDAVTRLAVDAAGQYSFWVRSRDFASDRPLTGAEIAELAVIPSPPPPSGTLMLLE